MIRIDEQSLRRMICGSSVVIGGVQMALDELPVDVILEAACQACSARLAVAIESRSLDQNGALLMFDVCEAGQACTEFAALAAELPPPISGEPYTITQVIDVMNLANQVNRKMQAMNARLRGMHSQAKQPQKPEPGTRQG